MVGMLTAAEPIGWNRDGSASFPAATPPPAFDGDTGKGILWKTRLPNWSNSSPIVVDTKDGPRVVLLSEPWDGYSPWLLCFDAVTGKELWRRELDAVPHLPTAEQEKARTLARKVWDLTRLRKRLTAEIQALYVKDRTGFSGKEVPPAAKPLVDAATAAGFGYRGISQSAGGYPNHLGVQFTPIEKELKALTALGLMPSEWDYQGTWDGVAYPTPISDGTRIWTVTMHNLYSCHDMEGKPLWQVRFAPPRREDLTKEQLELDAAGNRGDWPGAWPGAGGFSTSPIMAEGKLVSCAGRMVRCLDAGTGKVLWSHPMRGEIGQSLGVPAFVVANGERFVVGVGNGAPRQPPNFEKPLNPIYRLADGAIVAVLAGQTSGKGDVSAPVVLDDLIVTQARWNETTLHGHRLVHDGNGWKLEEVWQLAQDKKQAIHLFRPTQHDGKLYNGGSVLDLRAGKFLANRRPPVNQGYNGSGGIMVGSAFLSWDFYGDAKSSDKTSIPGRARFVWVEPASGKQIGEGFLPINPADGHPLAFKREQACRDSWRWLGAATPFAYKDRLYIRAYDFLWCIGRTP
jgi:outer membrane protein assembly factor BamB